MVAELLPAEGERSCVVSVSPGRERPVRPRVGGDERAIASSRPRYRPGPRRSSLRRAAPAAGTAGSPVGRRPSTSRSRRRRRHLPVKLGDRQRPARARPASRSATAAEEEAGEDDPAASASRWFPLTSENSRFRGNEVAVQVHGTQQAGAGRQDRARIASAERVEEPRQRQDADRGLHRARPVDARPVRVRLDPLLERVADDLAYSSSPSSRYAWPAGSSRCRRGSPGNLHVARRSTARTRGRAAPPAPSRPRDDVGCQSAGRSGRNGPVPSRSRVRSARAAPPARARAHPERRARAPRRQSQAAETAPCGDDPSRRQACRRRAPPTTPFVRRLGSRRARGTRSVLTVASAQPTSSTTRGGLVSALRGARTPVGPGAAAKPPGFRPVAMTYQPPTRPFRSSTSGFRSAPDPAREEPSEQCVSLG